MCYTYCLLYTSDAADDLTRVDLGGRRIIKKKLFKKIDDPLSRIKKLNTPKNITLKDNSYNILVTGIGGTGVVTIGALIGMAARIEKKGVSILDQVGIAQKGGAVLSHIKIANKPENIYSTQIACLLYTSPSPRDRQKSRMPSSA